GKRGPAGQPSGGGGGRLDWRRQRRRGGVGDDHGAQRGPEWDGRGGGDERSRGLGHSDTVVGDRGGRADGATHGDYQRRERQRLVGARGDVGERRDPDRAAEGG